MAEAFVVEIVRGGLVESVHLVDVAVVEDGKLARGAGDAGRVAFWRSSLKPIQAAVSMASGWVPAAEEEIAIASASHDGTPKHVEVVEGILAKSVLGAEALRCPAVHPLSPSAAAEADGPAAILNNCSGKHAAFLAACVAQGWERETYLDANHPLQIAVEERARELTGGDWGKATDGCGAVTPAAPLERMARAFGTHAAEEKAITSAMRAHPFLVGGEGRLDTDVMKAADGLVSKAGAEALFCFAHPEKGIAGAMKCRDGTPRALAPVAVAVLAELGLLDPEKVPNHARPPVPGGGRPAGRLEATGTLAPA